MRHTTIDNETQRENIHFGNNPVEHLVEEVHNLVVADHIAVVEVADHTAVVEVADYIPVVADHKTLGCSQADHMVVAVDHEVGMT
jgi:hypothetical protein